MDHRNSMNQLWQKRWDKGDTTWHKEQVNPFLKEFFTSFTGEVAAKSILVPLCGKSVDLIWLHKKGMNVIGVELVKRAIEEFFDEHNMVYTVEESSVLPECLVYRHEDRMTIYQCDFFKITSELFGGPVDFLWDHGSLVAIEYESKLCYSKVIQSVFSSSGEGLVEVVGYDRTLHPGPPFSTVETDVVSFFSGKFSVEKLCEWKATQLPGYASKIPGLAEADYKVFYIQGMNR